MDRISILYPNKCCSSHWAQETVGFQLIFFYTTIYSVLFWVITVLDIAVEIFSVELKKMIIEWGHMVSIFRIMSKISGIIKPIFMASPRVSEYLRSCCINFICKGFPIINYLLKWGIFRMKIGELRNVKKGLMEFSTFSWAVKRSV